MEIVIRAAVMFCIVWLITRAVGKRELGQMSAFELVLLVAVGDLIQQSVTQEDYSLTGGILVVATFALLTVVLSYVSWRFGRARPIIDGAPTVVVRDAEPDLAVLRYERLPMDDLREAARAKGIRNLDEVQLAVLEPNGAFTFFCKNRAGQDGATEPGSPV